MQEKDKRSIKRVKKRKEIDMYRQPGGRGLNRQAIASPIINSFGGKCQ